MSTRQAIRGLAQCRRHGGDHFANHGLKFEIAATSTGLIDGDLLEAVNQVVCLLQIAQQHVGAGAAGADKTH